MEDVRKHIDIKTEDTYDRLMNLMIVPGVHDKDFPVDSILHIRSTHGDRGPTNHPYLVKFIRIKRLKDANGGDLLSMHTKHITRSKLELMRAVGKTMGVPTLEITEVCTFVYLESYAEFRFNIRSEQ